MRLGIKVKFAGILVLATVLPLVVGILAVNFLGFRAFRDAQGDRFGDKAGQMADFLALTIDGSIIHLHDWLALGGYRERIGAISETLPPLEDPDFQRSIIDLEERWPDLEEDSPEMQAFLANELARDLQRFQSLNPLFVEIFVTDRHGRLVASTNKTTDYWQANERWWQQGMKTPFGTAHIEGINYDESAGVYSFDLAIPIRDPDNPGAEPAGVAKGVLQASAIFYAMVDRVALENVRWKIVLQDGRILFAEGREILADELAPEPLVHIGRERSGWVISQLMGNDRQLIGFRDLPWKPVSLFEEEGMPTRSELERQLELFAASNLADEPLGEELASLFVLVHAPTREVFSPVFAQLRNVTVAGLALLLLSTAAGFLIARNGIILPIRALQRATRHVSTSARLEELEQRAAAEPLRPSTKKILEQLAANRSTDELGELTHDIEAMAKRVLSYHEQLEADIAVKTRDMRRDLELAREYQEALMPRTYPRVPVPGAQTQFKLRFHHAYVPARTVGGDFFNIIRISDERAGVFIGDVMGHGACSALVTAIIGTLLYDLAHEVQEPAALMAHMNRQFHRIMEHCSQLVFVSAFYMVIDLSESTATFTSAGHPAPLHARRRSGRIMPLLSPTQADPALGLLAESEYANYRLRLSEDSLFFLFTDGLLEARNSEGEEFGRRHLDSFLREHLHQPIPLITSSLLEELTAYTGTSSFIDDICFLAIEVGENRRPVVSEMEEKIPNREIVAADR